LLVECREKLATETIGNKKSLFKRQKRRGRQQNKRPFEIADVMKATYITCTHVSNPATAKKLLAKQWDNTTVLPQLKKLILWI
jgi:hypothetical protein